MNIEFKNTIDNIINNSVCLKCYKKINRFRDNYKYNTNLKDLYKIKPYFTHNNSLYLKHKPCNFVIDITYEFNYIINELDIRYSFFRDKKTSVDVFVNRIISEDNSIYFVNKFLYKGKWYEIESDNPFCRKMVNKYLNNLIFE